MPGLTRVCLWWKLVASIIFEWHCWYFMCSCMLQKYFFCRKKLQHCSGQQRSYPEIGDINFKCTFKQQLTLKMRGLCRISIVLQKKNVFVLCLSGYTSSSITKMIISSNVFNYSSTAKIHKRFTMRFHRTNIKRPRSISGCAVAPFPTFPSTSPGINISQSRLR